MQNLQLHFSHRDPPDRPLAPGVHRLVRMANGIVDLSQEIQGVRLVAQLCIDRRGLWLQVADGIRGVHVNGRPVRSMAMLRAGDVVHADGVEFVLRTPRPPLQLPAEVADAEAPASDPRIVLRGIGGAYHGRSFTLDRPVLVGSAPDADIVVDDPAFAPRHARIERVGERVMLRGLGAEGSQVNGVMVRDAALEGGDQLAFDVRHRFVLDLPVQAMPKAASVPAAADGDEDLRTAPADAAGAARAGSMRRWPWLLLAALLLAGGLAALLVFGGR